MDIKEIKSVEVMPGFKGRIIHGSDFTWVYWEIEKGASLKEHNHVNEQLMHCLLYTSPSPRDVEESRMPSSA